MYRPCERSASAEKPHFTQLCGFCGVLDRRPKPVSPHFMGLIQTPMRLWTIMIVTVHWVYQAENPHLSAQRRFAAWRMPASSEVPSLAVFLAAADPWIKIGIFLGQFGIHVLQRRITGLFVGKAGRNLALPARKPRHKLPPRKGWNRCCNHLTRGHQKNEKNKIYFVFFFFFPPPL